MTEIFPTEYLRRLMKFQLNGKNKIKAANTWAVSLIRNRAGTIKWSNFFHLRSFSSTYQTLAIVVVESFVPYPCALPLATKNAQLLSDYQR